MSELKIEDIENAINILNNADVPKDIKIGWVSNDLVKETVARKMRER